MSKPKLTKSCRAERRRRLQNLEVCGKASTAVNCVGSLLPPNHTRKNLPIYLKWWSMYSKIGSAYSVYDLLNRFNLKTLL